jgi:diaminopimelate decarboxylase
VALADIAERFGTPAYVYSRAALSDAIGSMPRRKDAST